MRKVDPRMCGAAWYLAAALALASLVAAYTAQKDSEAAAASARAAGARASILTDTGLAVTRSLVEAEASQRGYLLTGDAAFLKGYETAKASLPSTLRRFAEADGGSAEEGSDIRRIRLLTTARLSVLDLGVDARQTEGVAAATAIVEGGTGAALMDQLRAVVGDLRGVADHNVRVAERRALAASERASFTGRVASGTLGTALLLMVALILHKGRLTRRHAAAEAERMDLAGQLARLSTRDAMTGLPNRRLLEDRIDRALARAERDRTLVAVAYVDFDDFQALNRTHGRVAGDRLLVSVGERLSDELRATDTLARVGPDQFVALVEGFASEADLEAAAERLRNAAEQVTIRDGSKQVSFSTSVGLVLAHHDRILPNLEDAAVTSTSLLAAAELAVRQAKENGGGCLQWYDPAHAEDRNGRQALSADLRTAMARGDQLWLAYQPLVNLDTEEVIGVEALVRWTHPTRGAISPSEFIPLAEASGHVVPLGEWVLRQACGQAAAWNRHRWRLGQPPLKMSINVSARQLLTPRFAETVRDVLAANRLAPQYLTLEITETALVDGAQGAARQLRDLADSGVTLALDDFGTGYSSLSYLRQFPFQLIKIDRSFTAGLGQSEADDAIVRAVIALGKNLQRPVLAEGIENSGQAHRLRELGCNYGQGYLYGRPEPARPTFPMALPAAV